MRPINVVHCGTGLTGSEALRAVIEDPALELVAVYVTTPSKEGLDAGELCGLPPTAGVAATSDLDAVVAVGADCVIYCGTAAGREREACEDIARFLRAGTNAVTFSLVALNHPSAAPADLREIIETACAEGQSSFYATGLEPGTASFDLPAAMLTMAGEVTGYRFEIHAPNMSVEYPIEDVLRQSMGFGMPADYVPPRIAYGVVQRWWSSDIAFVADRLGVTLTSIDLDWATACTPVDIVTHVGTYDAGTVCSTKWTLTGRIGDRAVVTVEMISKITTDAFAPDTWPTVDAGGLHYIVEGRPPFRAHLKPGTIPGENIRASIVMTARSAVNAIPAIVAAGPGHLSFEQMGQHYTRCFV